MKNKMYYFTEWLLSNETFLARLDSLQPGKKLFWLGWLQWHLRFYLDGVEFVLLFPKQRKPTLIILSKKPIHLTRKKAQPDFLNLDFQIWDWPDASIEDISERIIDDIEAPGPDRKPANEATTTFAQAISRNCSIFCDLTALPYAEQAIATRLPHCLSPASLTWVRLQNTLFEQHRCLVTLYEYDHYTDYWSSEREH